MSSKSSKKSNKAKNRSGSASDAGSAKEFIEREADIDNQQQQEGSITEPTSAETQAVAGSDRIPPPSTSLMDMTQAPDDPSKISPANSVYGEVFRDEIPPVQVAILEPEIAVAASASFPQEPLPTHADPSSGGQEGGLFSSLFSCCVSRK
jgi:hypothetical protein